ncbi:MAG TPA: response regulator [Chryseosolibacter sp.]
MEHSSTKPLSFLIIDDDPDDQEIFCSAIHEVVPGCICQTVNDAQQLIAHMEIIQQTPDTIFVDINMPKMDGFQFLRHARNNSRLRDVKIVLMSTSNSIDDKRKAEMLGANAFITKTNTYKELCEALNKYLVHMDERKSDQ